MKVVVAASVLALALLGNLALSGSAFAHAVVLETNPQDGSLLETAPGSIVVLFNEPVSPVRAQVLDATGSDITPTDPVTLAGAELKIALPPALAPGSYIASYRVVSLDSHPIAGSIIFSVGQVSATVASTTPTDDVGWRFAMAAVRALLFAGILGGAGGVLFLLLVLPGSTQSEPRIRATISVFAAAGCVAAVLALGVQGGLLINGTAGSLLESATWRMGVGSRYGRTAMAALVGLALVVAGLRFRPGSAMRSATWMGTALALVSFSLSGHIVPSGPRWLTAPALILHTAAAAFWAGSLLPLRHVLASEEVGAAPIVTRFSRLAVVAVAILVVAGTIIAVLQVRSAGVLLTTAYGLALMLKLALVAGLIALAAFNKLRLTPALARRESAALGALRRTIAVELSLVLPILVVTGVLGTRPPPRVIAEGAAHVASHGTGSASNDIGLIVTLVQERYSADIELGSAWSGVTRARIAIRDKGGTSLEAKEVTFIASNPGVGVEPIRRVADLAKDGTWNVDNLLLAPAGRWTLRVEALVSDFERVILETRIDLVSASPPAGA